MASATLKDVAKYANVSQATVSRVLNGNTTVDEVMRDRVHAAILALGYQPNRAARRLRAPSSTVIGLIISDVENPFFMPIIRGVEDAAYARNMNIILCNSDEDISKQSMYLDVMRAERVAGLILIPSPGTSSKSLNTLVQSGIGLTLIDRCLEGVTADTVKVDNVSGAYSAVKHVIDLGYRRIAIIIHSPNISTGPERYEGYLKALNSAHIAFDPDLVKYGDISIESGYQAAYHLLNLPNPPDAIFASNNVMSMGALRAFRELGKRVPEDIALIGFDNLPWLGEFASPLTAISQPSYELGQEAVALLLRRIAQPSAPARTVILQTTLIVRESCGSSLTDDKRRKSLPE